VWDDTGNRLLTRQVVATARVRTIMLPVSAEHPFTARLYSGWGLFRAGFVPPPPGQMLEVRVWSPGHVRVNVYRATITPVR
jgi:hypothetical protein